MENFYGNIRKFLESVQTTTNAKEENLITNQAKAKIT
jgi:hypothetical protein